MSIYIYTDKTSLKADREVVGGLLRPKGKGKGTLWPQELFPFPFGLKVGRARPDPGGLIQLQSSSDRITHTGTIKISRSDSPPNLRYAWL